jgi:hypothetical protein
VAFPRDADGNTQVLLSVAMVQVVEVALGCVRIGVFVTSVLSRNTAFLVCAQAFDAIPLSGLKPLGRPAGHPARPKGGAVDLCSAKIDRGDSSRIGDIV